jgi:hypothetical protein
MAAPTKIDANQTGISPVVPVRLSRDQLKRVDEAAKRRGCTRSRFMREAIENALAGEMMTSA